MAYSHVVFDFDGTLADSLERAIAIFQRIGPALGLKPIGDIAAARSMPTRQFLKQIGVGFWKLPKVVRAYHAALAEEAGEIRLFPEMLSVLPELTARGHRLGILSSNSEANIRAALAANGVEPLFAFVVGYPKLFGKAKALRRILKQHKIGREDVLYVGDEVRDVEAARRAKVAVAAASWGYHAEPLLRAAQPTYLLHAPGDLLTTVRPS
jgi:phosphoglycolate phosphatase